MNKTFQIYNYTDDLFCCCCRLLFLHLDQLEPEDPLGGDKEELALDSIKELAL